MSISHEFDYRRPGSLEEAHELLREAGDGAALLAGGTDLVAWLRDGVVLPSLVVDLKGVPGLGEIVESGGSISLGALVTFADAIDSEVIRGRLPLIWEMARVMGSTGIRNRATISGNICSGVPSCDSGPVLLVLEAVVRVSAPGGEREAPINDWFKGPKKTDLRSGEIVVGLSIDAPGEGHGACYVKLRRNRGEDLAQAGVAVLALPDMSYRVAFGAVAPTPVRARRIESCLAGRHMDDAALVEAVGLVTEETSPIGDIRASLEYREHMLPVMLTRALRAAAARRDGDGPAYGTSLI